MVKKTYTLTEEDARKLVSYACRYRQIATNIDEYNRKMNVYTTFVHTNEAISLADQLELVKVSDDPPKMPEEEHRRRVEGKFPE